jgi:hypothetical protein
VDAQTPSYKGFRFPAEIIILGATPTKPEVMHHHRGDRGRVQRLGLARMTGLKQPRPNGPLGRHIHDLLTRSRHSLSHASSSALGAFHPQRRCGQLTTHLCNWHTIVAITTTGIAAPILPCRPPPRSANSYAGRSQS